LTCIAHSPFATREEAAHVRGLRSVVPRRAIAALVREAVLLELVEERAPRHADEGGRAGLVATTRPEGGEDPVLLQLPHLGEERTEGVARGLLRRLAPR